MPFTVVEEPVALFKTFRVYENCCFCKKPTKFWYLKKEVACCEDCAKLHKVKEVPTKNKWCDGQNKEEVI